LTLSIDKEATDMKIGFIGFGEAASSIAAGLYDEGVRNIIAYDTMADHATAGPLIHKKAEDVHVEIKATPGEVAREAEVIIASVPSKYCLDACDSVKEYLHEGQIYADTSASLPESMKEIEERLKGTGALFADVAMLGALLQCRHKVPILVSGSGAQQFHDLMTPYHMQIEVIDEIAGNASSIKLVRSVLLKGISGLVFTTLFAAEKYGIAERTVQSICETMDGFGPFITNFKGAVGGVKHYARRADELAHCVEMLDRIGVDSTMARGAQAMLEYAASFHLEEKYVSGAPEDFLSIIREMLGKE